MNFCPNCGKRADKQNQYCANCGQKLRVNVDTDNSDSTPSFDYSDEKRHANVRTKKPEQGSFEDDAEIEFEELHPNAIWLISIRYLGRSIILVPLIIAGAILMPPLWLLLVAYLLVHYVIARLVYNNYRFRVDSSSFHKEYGIIHKRHASIPFDTIENINLNRNLLDRLLGLAHVEIETAGVSGNAPKDIVAGVSATSEGYIPGLSYREARDLRDLLLRRAKNYHN